MPRFANESKNTCSLYGPVKEGYAKEEVPEVELMEFGDQYDKLMRMGSGKRDKIEKAREENMGELYKTIEEEQFKLAAMLPAQPSLGGDHV